MALAAGTRLGPYVITAPIGAGGMGEVYKATDTRLERTVAIKVLPAHVASDPQRKQRFEREAKVISGLNHPHICTLYEFDNHEGTDFLVMEYLEGETLAERLTKGALPLDQALKYAIEIADALVKAHRQGVTHRDLKPANIMLTKAGAKLLDFGLAKLKAPGGEAGASALPTVSANLTAQGSILGTLQYMSPEQLEGNEADHRTDIFAFGTLLYEMATGKKAFEGKSQASLIAAILEREPPAMSSLEPLTPAGLDYVAKTCLAKDPDDRWQTARDLLRELRRVEAGGVVPGEPVSTPALQQPALWQRPVPATLAAVLLMVLTGLAIWVATRATLPPQSVTRFPIVLPADQQLIDYRFRLVALSPDGKHLAYSANRQLFLRGMDREDAMPIPVGGSDTRDVFFSPDGLWLGFYSVRDGTLKKVALSGGAAVTLCNAPGFRGASWGADNTILFWQSAGILRVAGAGGTPEVLIPIEEGEAAGHPQILPGGHAVLFTFVATGRTWNQAQIVVQSLDTGERRVLVEGGTDARYVPTGHLVYAQEGTVFAVPFDPERLIVTGGAVPLVESVAQSQETGTAQFSVSRTGSLVYLPGGRQEETGQGGLRTLVWVDREGREEPLAAEPRGYTYPRISPDGSKAALDVKDQNQDIWIWDFSRESLTRLTFDAANDNYPVWTPDGERVLWGSTRTSVGGHNLFWKAADGTGSVERLTESRDNQFPHAFSPDGMRLVFRDSRPGTGRDIRVLSLEGERATEPVLSTAFNEWNPEFSPDGRWLAYQSDESGQDDVYVRPFPNVDDGRWQISTGGGVQPLWGPDGRELFYWAPGGGRLMVAPIQSDARFTAGRAEVLFEGPYFAGGAGRTYDISPDGQRFLMIKEDATVDADDRYLGLNRIHVILNWFAELERLVPTP